MYVKDKDSFTYISKDNPDAIPLVQQMNHNNGISAYVDKNKLPVRFKNKIEKAGKISINPDQPLSYYQPTEFIGNSVIIIDTSKLTKNQALYVVAEIQRMRKGSTWNDKFPKEQVKIAKIQLPTKNGKIDFEFIEGFIAELEAYLTTTGLRDYTLTSEEERVLKDFESGKVELSEFTYANIFDNIAQGRRLKKDDQISGKIPFVMAGTTNTGVVNYISNPVASFPKNSITVDIFGNVFYRKYDYGAGDDTGVYWNAGKKYSKETMLFFTASMGKSLFGKFSFGNKLRSSQSLHFTMQLPAQNKQPNYSLMETFISAIQKLVIRDVVDYADRRIEATKKVIGQ